ncbi:MAG: dUTP diphosphatase [Myxococcales bacterium]|nr:dUTP diphosphatase [Myxococcales bacterium]
MEVLWQRLVGAEAPDPLPLPAAATAQAAGLDLRAALRAPLVLDPGARAVIPTGFALALPPDHEGQVRPRSGRALRDGLTVLNAPGTIDADYRGELQVLLVNLGRAPVTLERGDRIAQLVVAPVRHVTGREVAALPATTRGAGGFGHTGDR